MTIRYERLDDEKVEVALGLALPRACEPKRITRTGEPAVSASLRAACSISTSPSIEGTLANPTDVPDQEAVQVAPPARASPRSAPALLFDPEDQAQVTDAVRRLLEDRALAARLAERGRARAAGFTWERTGAATLAGYREALATRGAGYATL